MSRRKRHCKWFWVFVFHYHKDGKIDCDMPSADSFPGSSFLPLPLLSFLLLLWLLSEADSPLSVFVLAKITSAAFSLRSLAGLHLWLVHALFDRHQGSRDAFTHGSSCIALFGHVMISSGARALHWSKEGGGPPLPPHGETLSCKLTFTSSCKLRMCAII